MKIELQYGIAIGIITAVYVMIEYVLGLHSTHLALGEYSAYFAMMIPIIGLYMAIKDKKEFIHGGKITLSQALMVGVVVNAISATIITAFWALYFTVIHPEFITYGLEFTKTQLIESGVTGAEYEAKIAQFERAFSLKNQLTFIPIGPFSTGMVVSLIMGILHQSKPTSGQNPGTPG